MADGKLAKVDSNETDVEKGPADGLDAKQAAVGNNNGSATTRTRKVEIDTGEELIRFRRHWWQIW